MAKRQIRSTQYINQGRTKFKNGKRKKPPQKSRGSRIWFGLLKFLGLFVLAGLLLLLWESAKLSSVISNARPIDQLRADTTGIVRLEGVAEGMTQVTDEGKLRDRYALLQKEKFQWHCSKSGCDYQWDEDLKPDVRGSFMLNGVNVQADWFRFYDDWLPLDTTTVIAEQTPNIHEGGSSRPLLVESPKKTAFGYYAVSPGEQVTVIGRAHMGRLEPIAYPGKDGQNVILIGTSVARMLSEERERQIGFGIVAGIVFLALLPIMIGWIRKYSRLLTK